MSNQGKDTTGSLRQVVRAQLKSDGLGIDKPGRGLVTLAVATIVLVTALGRLITFVLGERDDSNRSFMGTGSATPRSEPRPARRWLPAPDPILVPKGASPDGFKTFQNARDGSVMVLVPEHEGIGPFLLSIHEVTVGQYARFAGSDLFRGDEQERDPQRPVVFVNWKQASEYCAWVGGRLPSDAEWNLAARGPARLPFPWGRAAPGRGAWPANVGNATALLASANPAGYAMVAGRLWSQYLQPVGSFPTGTSPYGLFDMVGNVDEWCQDDWEGGGASKVTRGGSWLLPEASAGNSWRSGWYWGGIRGDLGFRVARDAPRGLLDLEKSAEVESPAR